VLHSFAATALPVLRKSTRSDRPEEDMREPEPSKEDLGCLEVGSEFYRPGIVSRIKFLTPIGQSYRV